jgi:hypothetical protein
MATPYGVPAQEKTGARVRWTETPGMPKKIIGATIGRAGRTFIVPQRRSHSSFFTSGWGGLLHF